MVVLYFNQFGRSLLTKHINERATEPSFRYNEKIVLVFCFVYSLMVSGQVRLVIVKCSGWTRSILVTESARACSYYSVRRYIFLYQQLENVGCTILFSAETYSSTF